MQLHLDEIATKITLAVTLFSSSIEPAGMAPRPSRLRVDCQKDISQFMRQNWLSNRIAISFDDIVCYSWNTLVNQPWKSSPSPAEIGQSQVTQSEDWYDFCSA